MEDKLDNLYERLSSLEKQMDLLIKLFGKGISNNLPTSPISSLGDTEDNLQSLLSLTPKQTATLQMIHNGYSTKEMSTLLDSSDSTSKTHLNALFNKFHARDRSNLILKTQDIFKDITDEVYLKHSGIPKDFIQNINLKKPCKYLLMLRKRRQDT